MPRIIDLSYPLGGDGANVPGHPAVEYVAIHTYEKHYRRNAWTKFSVHVGTHVDPPCHFTPDGWTIDEVPVERLMGRAYVFNLRGRVADGAPIRVEHILQAGRLPAGALKGAIAIVNSDWARRMYQTDRYYFDGPYLDVEAARWLVNEGVTAIGLDHPPDKVTELPPSPGDMPVHRTLLGNRVCIIENLANLEQITKPEVQIFAVHIKIHKGCGGPARVIAIED